MAQQERSNQSQPNRRDFVLGGTGLAGASLAALTSASDLFADEVREAAKSIRPLIEPGNTVLFQGDSITDAVRKRDQLEPNLQTAFGSGYAWLAASQLMVDSPDSGVRFFNRGVSGNKVFQLADRWQEDCLDIKPDVLSILVGVNDFAHVFKHGYEGSVEKYEADYHALLKRTKDELPNVKIIICEPFVLVTGMVEENWLHGYKDYREAAKRVADEAGAVFVPFQTMFDHAAKIAPPEYWAGDGVHPTPSGAALMAHWWLKAVGA